MLRLLFTGILAGGSEVSVQHCVWGHLGRARTQDDSTNLDPTPRPWDIQARCRVRGACFKQAPFEGSICTVLFIFIKELYHSCPNHRGSSAKDYVLIKEKTSEISHSHIVKPNYHLCALSGLHSTFGFKKFCCSIPEWWQMVFVS